MSKVIVTKNSVKFNDASDAAWDMALGHMGIDILRLSQMQVPHLTGRLQSSKLLVQKAKKNWEVQYRTEYAAAIHDNNKHYKIKKGRKDHYLSDPGQQISKNSQSYFNEAMGFIKGAM